MALFFCLQVTGHVDGSVLMWDPTGDSLKPVLLVDPERGARKKAVKSVAILEELSLLAVGHANGKVGQQPCEDLSASCARLAGCCVIHSDQQ